MELLAENQLSSSAEIKNNFRLLQQNLEECMEQNFATGICRIIMWHVDP
jgi:hypothetical protein